MNILVRAGRTYWRLNEIAWQYVRRAAVPIIVATGVASAALWFIGAMNDDQVLVWAPAVYAWPLALAWVIARLLP